MGSEDLGGVAGAFLSDALPMFVNQVKTAIFTLVVGDVIDFLNNMLSGSSLFFSSLAKYEDMSHLQRNYLN